MGSLNGSQEGPEEESGESKEPEQAQDAGESELLSAIMEHGGDEGADTDAGSTDEGAPSEAPPSSRVRSR